MKTIIKILIITTLLLNCTFLLSQENISVNTYIDPKLMILGDDKGNPPSTLNLLIKAELQGNETNVGYLIVVPSYEYANLQGGKYQRWSAGVGFTFQNKRFELTPLVNYGIIQRYNASFMSFEGVLDLSYKLSNRFKISALNSLTQRKDIDYNYGSNNWVWNFNLGVKFNLKKG